MYRTSTQEPRYKRSLYEREPRHVESKECSEDYTSSSEEEDESSEKYTEESDEETIESHESYSLPKRSEWSPAFEQQWSYNKLEKSEKKTTNPNICDTRFYKQDKVTQKNLLSPFPSFLIPPIPRQVTGQPHYRLQKVGSVKEEQNNSKNSTKYAPKKNQTFKEEEDATRVIHKCHDGKERNVSQKPKLQEDQDYQSKVCSSDQVSKCLHIESPEESLRNFSKPTAETERLSKQPTSIPTYLQRPKSSTRENTKNQQTMTKFADCTLEHEIREKSRPKTAIGVIPCKKNTNIREALLARNIGDGKQANKKGGEVKEKLVYVVEEEGKEITKLETDLFTINEILAIKRDLLELSEFAKKLKKLKEMKKESENLKNKENTCRCKPAEELLKDVNKRIEILEAKQEELERGTNRVRQKEDIETESKNTNVTKISSGSQSKTPEIIQSSAMTAVPSFPKTKIFVTRPERFSKNAEIVKELLDIKTQLQRLEKRRISKEVSNEVDPEESTKLVANKNRAIAVFSSKTYIFTSENFDKRNLGEKTINEGKGRNFVSSVEENTTKREQRKANVASWLKNVKVEQTETDVSMFLSAEKSKRNENAMKEPKGNANLKCRNCVQALKEKDFESQEPQKSRVLERDEKKSNSSFAKLLKNESFFKEINRYVGYKKCVMTPSGRLFALMSESSEKVLNIPTAGKPESPPAANPQWLSSRAIHRGGSSGSITSAILAKQQVNRVKAQRRADKHCTRLIPRPSQSKSLQELSMISNFCEVEKNARNANVKNYKKAEASPLSKDKNDFVKYLEAHLMALKKNFEKREPTTSSCTYSEFLASINLESEETSATLESSTLRKNIASNEIYAYMASTKTKLNALDSQDRQGKNCEDSKKEKAQKQRKKEKKEKKKSELQKKSKPKKEKKCKEPTKQMKCKKKKKKKPHHCKSKNSDCFNFWENYYGDEFFNYKEKKPISYRPKIPNEDNLKMYRKQQTERSKTNLDCKNQNVDSFTIRNIFKNLGRYYPKISNFHLFALPRGEVCDRKEEEHTMSGFNKTGITNKSEDDFDDEDNENDKDYNQTSDDSYACQSLHINDPSDQKRRHYYSQSARPGDLKNCRCVQVYLQTQEERGWSGLGPFRALSTESMTKESTSRSTGSCKLKRSESLLPVKKSQIQYVGHSTQICEKKKLKCDKKHKKKRKHKRKCCTVCVCCKCRHIHKSKKKKHPKSENECKTKSITCECPDSKFQKPCFCGGKLPGENPPLFSFLSSFCKTKPRETTFSKSIANKFSEIRCLKTCPRVQTNFFSKLRNHLLVSCDNEARSKQCHCISKLQDIENKLKKLEKVKSCNCSHKKEEEKKKKKEKKKCMRIEKKICCCSESMESNYSCHCAEYICCEDKKKRKKEKKKKKKKCKKEKKICCCSESVESIYSCQCAEYICCEDKKKRKKEKKKKKKKCKKMKKKCCCSDSPESNYSCQYIEGLYSEDEEKKKMKCCKKKKKKKHKKHKTKCCCCERKVDDKKYSGAYYYTVECHSSDIAPEASTNKTTEEEKEDKKANFSSVTKSKELLEQTNTRLKNKLPSSTSFWEGVRKYDVEKNQNEILKNLTKIKNNVPTELLDPEIMFLSTCKKSDSKAKKNQCYEMKENSKTLLKKVAKIRRWGKKTNEEEKKEKKTLRSEPKNGSRK